MFAAMTAPDFRGVTTVRDRETLLQLVSELAALLSNTGLRGPYILVGHSFGALVIRAFAHLHATRVAGLVFVDPVLDSSTGRIARIP